MCSELSAPVYESFRGDFVQYVREHGKCNARIIETGNRSPLVEARRLRQVRGIPLGPYTNDHARVPHLLALCDTSCDAVAHTHNATTVVAPSPYSQPTATESIPVFASPTAASRLESSMVSLKSVLRHSELSTYIQMLTLSATGTLTLVVMRSLVSEQHARTSHPFVQSKATTTTTQGQADLSSELLTVSVTTLITLPRALISCKVWVSSRHTLKPNTQPILYHCGPRICVKCASADMFPSLAHGIDSTPPEVATGRSQWNFPMSGPLGPPGQGRPLGARHGVHASISGPISTPPISNGFQPQFGAGGQRGPPPAGGRMPIPPMPGQQSPQRPVMPPIPPFNGGASSTPPIMEGPNRQSPAPGSARSPPPGQGPMVAMGPPRSRRQYAKNAAAYIAGDPTGGVGSIMSGHGHSQSQQFFSPAQRDAAPQFFTPGAQQSAPMQQPSAPSNNDHVMYGQPPQSQSAGGFADPMSGMANQFGQMGIGGQKPMQMVTTTNLINLPLNPAELMQLSPPDIRLPPNVSSLLRCQVCRLKFLSCRLHSHRAKLAIQIHPTNDRQLTRCQLRTRFCRSRKYL